MGYLLSRVSISGASAIAHRCSSLKTIIITLYEVQVDESFIRNS